MKQRYGHSIFAPVFSGDKAAAAARAARRRSRQVKKTRQEKAELNVWGDEGGNSASFSPPS